MGTGRVELNPRTDPGIISDPSFLLSIFRLNAKKAEKRLDFGRKDSILMLNFKTTNQSFFKRKGRQKWL